MNVKKTFSRYAIFASVMAFGFACSHSEKLVDNEFLIEGRLSDVEDGTIILLLRTNDNKMNGSNIMVTDTVKNGHFTFKGEVVSNPDWLSILAISEGFPPMPQDVWVAPKTKVKIEGKGKILPLWEVKSSVPYQKEANIYKDKCRDIIAEYARTHAERSYLLAKRNAAASEEETLVYRKSLDSNSVMLTSLTEKLYLAYADVMAQMNISTIWLDKMLLIARSLNNYDNLRNKANELYAKMSEEDKNTSMGQLITVSLFPPTVVGVGDSFADADLLDINGETKQISDYLGKYLLLDFWSRGCGPCIMALPEMKEISETYSENLTIISISLDTEDWWKEAMASHEMPWVNIRDSKGWGGLAASYGVNGIPNYVIISPEGKVVDKWAGYGTGYLKTKIGEKIVSNQKQIKQIY